MDYQNYSKRRAHLPNAPSQKKHTVEFEHDERYLPQEVRNNIPESFNRRHNIGHRHRNSQRKSTNKLNVILIMVISFTLLVLFFALFRADYQVANIQEPVIEQDSVEEENLSNHPPAGRSAEQDLLNELYWVDQDFLDINRFSRPGYLIGEVNGIVIHFIGNPNTTAGQNRNFFNNLATTEERHASSNFIVCLDGRIVQCVPVDEVAYASHHRNYDSISIELCHPDISGAFTDETLTSAIRLTAWLSVQFDLTADDIIRHYDIVRADGSQKRCPRYFVDNEDAWESFKDAVTSAMREFR